MRTAILRYSSPMSMQKRNYFRFYASPAKIGDQIEVQAKTLRGGHSIAFLEVLMKNRSTGDILVKGNHNMFILHPHLIDDHAKKHLENLGHLKLGDIHPENNTKE